MSEAAENNQLLLISGESATGKSASLMNIRDQEDWLYLNTESGKRLPFRNNFRDGGFRITDPYEVIDAFEFAINDDPSVKGIILDSLTFWMDMLETQYVVTAADTRAAWSEYQQTFKRLMQELVPKFGKPVIIIAHTRTDYDESTMTMRTSVPIKGSLRNTGVEAYFSTVVSSKVMPLKQLEEYKNDMLTITEDDKLIDMKYVFQTRHTKKTTGERIRSPLGFFSVNETFINNDAQMVLDHLNKMYGVN
ncbi:hypothetical protein ZC03_011 [Pseudomonas phage ZC03]|uniref:AAA domain protein n=2 Tax=Zicotriavirus TaxID=2843161 RepID=A0A1L2C919_9CAUD|nr:Sak4-like ssDNA annealing protein [Pseudomonas phage ZC03]YP_009830582.1 Sak4-like ssDNA annealing protein [Pseudomonas phage ZC08]AMD43398.1 hypothetical protein ZC03_011 [Pseudomonas phage ZC03]AMD43545.1 hypothetical protein ZC08_011 [Pseudomonas phage ZC08]